MNENAKPYLDEFKHTACLALLDTLKPKSVTESRIASDVLRISKTIISFCHIAPTPLYHRNACTAFKVAIVETRHTHIHRIEAAKNKRAIHDGKKTNGEKGSIGAVQSAYRIEWEKKAPNTMDKPNYNSRPSC